MSIEIKMPMLSPTMTKGVISNWLVAIGDKVSIGDILVEVEADKVTIEIEATEDGVIEELCAEIGDEIPVEQVIIKLAAPGAEIKATDKDIDDAPYISEKTTENILTTVDSKPETKSIVNESPVNNEKISMSPLARRMAMQENIDTSAVQGSGAKGKVMKRDIERLMGVAENDSLLKVSDDNYKQRTITEESITIDYDTLPAFKRTNNSGMRSVVASRLTASSRDIPHFYMSVDCEIDKLLSIRKELNQRKNATYKISVNDFVVKAIAVAMKEVPTANCMWDNDSVIYFDDVDISIAVAVEDGLITPVVKKACGKGLANIANQSKALAEAARNGTLKPSDYQGGTFTVSNLGMFGIDNFTSIINPPQNGILSVGAGKSRPVVKDGELAIATVMTVTLAMDHRCVDGAVGAAFIKVFKETIEDPISLML